MNVPELPNETCSHKEMGSLLYEDFDSHQALEWRRSLSSVAKCYKQSDQSPLAYHKNKGCRYIMQYLQPAGQVSKFHVQVQAHGSISIEEKYVRGISIHYTERDASLGIDSNMNLMHRAAIFLLNVQSNIETQAPIFFL